MSSVPEDHERKRATWAAVGAILLWCASGVCFARGARLLGAMAYLTLMAAIGVATVVLRQWFQSRKLRDLIRLPVRVMVAGFWGVAVYTVMLTFAFGIAADDAIGQVNLLNYLWPVWIVLLSPILLRERMRPLPVAAGVVLGFAGIVAARGPAELYRMPAETLPLLLALVGGFLWAVYCVLLRRWGIPPEKGGTAFHFTLCALLAALIGWIRGEWQHLPPINAEAIFWVLFGGIGPVGLAYSWWEIGVKRGHLPLISTLAYFIPIGSTLLIALVFRETLGPWLFLGAALIATGAWFSGHAGRADGSPDGSGRAGTEAGTGGRGGRCDESS